MSTLAAPAPALPWWKEPSKDQWYAYIARLDRLDARCLRFHDLPADHAWRCSKLPDLVLCNMPVAIAQHVEWITGSLAHMREHGLERIEATPDAVDRWVQHMNDAANTTLLPQAKHSWYLGANVPGKPC
jgi:hypothetical protein